MAYQSEIEKLEQRYRENPDQWFAALADSYRKAGSLDLALDVVKAGLDKRPNYVSGYIVLGRCLLQKPDDGAAAQAFEKVLSLDAENVIALKALSEVSERAGRLGDAVRWLSRLLEVDPMNDDAEQSLARLKQQVAAAAPPPPAAPAEEAAGAAEVAEAAEALESVPPGELAPVAGLEATIEEAPQAPELEPEIAIEKSHGATEAPEPGVVSLEPLELEGAATSGGAASPEPSARSAPSAPPAEDGGEVAGLQPMAFEPPPAGEIPAPVADLEPMEFTAPKPAAAEPAPPPVEPVLDAPSSGGDLPLIYPDEVTAGGDGAARESDAPTPAGAEPEPVVTETMAELYAKQGLMAEARDIYRKLAIQRPADGAVAGRLRELEVAVSGRRPSGGARVEARGGPSARDFFAGVFGGAPVPSSPVPVPSGGEAGTGKGESAPAPALAPAPTRRASDEVSLAAVFGEEPQPARPAAAAAQPSAKPAGPGFSFDEFFGGQRRPSGAPGTTGDEKGGEDEDDFKRWLKGLKS